MAISEIGVTQSKAERRSQLLQELLNLGQPTVSRVPESLRTIQSQAAARIPELAIPSTRQEDWRFTDLSPLLDLSLASPGADTAGITIADLEPVLLPDTAGRLVFVNGYYSAALSDIESLPAGFVVGNLERLAPECAGYLGKQGDASDVFSTLNTATFADAAVIWAQRHVVVEQPLQVLFVSAISNEPHVTQPRCLIVAESGSQFSLIEEYVTVGNNCQSGSANGCYLTNAVTEICLQSNAMLHHSRLQRDANAAIHIGKTAVNQERDSTYTNVAIQLGSQLGRHNLEVLHCGEQVSTNLQGLAMVTGDQLLDTHSAILYSQPHGQSDQLYKAIVTDRGHAVFNGRVEVPQAAQLTNAAQLNRNLLLSPKARVDTKPELKIVADNVKCTHGATVSQLEDDEIFYLQSRGIDREAAQNLLIDAFAAEIIQQIPNTLLRDTLSRCISCQTLSLF